MTSKSKLVCPTKDPIQANLFFQPINDEYYGVTSAQQLQATTKHITDWTRGLKGFTFIPLLVSGRMDKHERRELNKSKNQISFRGDKLKIERIRCGSELRQIFD